MFELFPLKSDIEIPIRFIIPIALEHGFSINEAGLSWGNPIHDLNIARDLKEWVDDIPTERQYLTLQAISSLVSPVSVWSLEINNLFQSPVNLNGIISDYDDVLPPLITWKDETGTQVMIKRVSDIDTLLENIENILISSGSVIGYLQAIVLPIIEFKTLLRIADCYHQQRIYSLLSHTPDQFLISHKDLLKLHSDLLYLTDTRWLLPAFLKYYCSDDIELDEESINAALEGLEKSGFIKVERSDHSLLLSPLGKELVSLFHPDTIRIMSKEIISIQGLLNIRRSHWIIRVKERLYSVVFGDTIDETITIKSCDDESLKIYHLNLINPIRDLKKG